MSLLRGFVETFPPLKIALYVNDAICFLFSRVLDLLYYVVKSLFRLVYFIIKHSYGPVYNWISTGCSKLSDLLPPIKRYKEQRERRRYERLPDEGGQHEGEKRSRPAKGDPYYNQEPEPYYESQLVKRAITYHGGLVLALFMYVFVYFVLVKHHTYLSISVAFVLLLIYMLLVENSHNIRSIIMLCLPIMFTNRGRALVFCSMLALLAGGPIRTMQHNVREIHLSLNCCKQYLIVHTDKYVGDNVVNKLVRMEEVVVNLVNNIKMFAQDLRQKFNTIIEMAIDTERYVMATISQLKQALNFCQHHSRDVHQNCARELSKMTAQCRSLAVDAFGICTIVNRLKDICYAPTLPEVLCELPHNVMEFFARTVGEKLAQYVDLIENELYVDVDVTRSYAYNVTKSKSYTDMTKEIKFDVEQKFWYVQIIRRVFNFVSLILVTWILLTATIYHMHYLRDLAHDNMYLDERLDEAAQPRKLQLTPQHERLYLRPFSVHMNKVEVSKLYVSGLVWLIIVCYITFFVALDFALFQLVDFLVETLREILFASDLPLIDLASKSQRLAKNTSSDGKLITEDKIVKYNRTYLSTLRKRLKTVTLAPLLGATGTKNLTNASPNANNISSSNNVNSTLLGPGGVSISGGGDTIVYTTNGTLPLASSNGISPSNITSAAITTSSTSSIQAFYDRLMDSLERDIPDDVAILESLEGCLPKAAKPVYDTYRALLFLAVFTLSAVFVEAYALRTRHCIANLYYPRRARRRAKWLFRKIMSERPKYDEMDELEGNDSSSRSKRDLGARRSDRKRRHDDHQKKHRDKEKRRAEKSTGPSSSRGSEDAPPPLPSIENAADDNDDVDERRSLLGYEFGSIESL